MLIKNNWRNLLMAKKSKIAKAKKQQETIERYAALRQELKAQKRLRRLAQTSFRCSSRTIEKS
jgi:hypothetical protein